MKKRNYDYGYMFTINCEATGMTELTTEINSYINKYKENYELIDVKFNSILIGSVGNIVHHYGLLTFKKINK